MASLHHSSPRISSHLPLYHLPPFPSRTLLSPPKPNLLLLRNPSRRASLRSLLRVGSRSGAVRSSEQSCDRAGDAQSSDRIPFDLNLAVLLAGFAFEAYTSPPSDAGSQEADGGGCQTMFLSEQFLREIYDGQLLIKLKRGLEFPSMDPWGTSDPYVVIQLESRVVKSTTKWATKEPTWNEDLTLNINRSTEQLLKIAAWDANLVTPHKRMGNAGIDLTSLCDGNLHELLVELEGIGGGGKIHLEVKYKSYDELDKEKQGWRIPFLSELIPQSNLESALRSALGTESVNASQFVEFAFGQLSLFNRSPQQKVPSFDGPIAEMKEPKDSANASKTADELKHVTNDLTLESSTKIDKHEDILASKGEDTGKTALEKNKDDQLQESDGYFWEKLAGSINQAVTQNLGFSLPISDLARWDGYNLLCKGSMLSQRNAEEEYVQSGLATPETLATPSSDCDIAAGSSPCNGTNTSAFDIKKVSREILSQTENVLGALMVLTTMFSQQNKDMSSTVGNSDKSNLFGSGDNITALNEINCTRENPKVNIIYANDMRELFSTAESAMEAWAMLCTSLGRTSFIKSDFQKICFLDNDATDTQVAIWRDPMQKRLVIAFRGTEQARWKDLRTDLMLVPSGLNPERLGGDFKEEVQVHSGFLSAYDSVRNRIMALVNCSIGLSGTNDFASTERWRVYVTGHSLGGALATLLALELSSSRLAKYNTISVTMYNFGSPRVGNRRFLEVYNKNVKDSWRVVNHRDIIPTVPRLMGYCHVAQPVYLAVGDLKDAMMKMEISEDGYRGDIIGEYTPDVLVNEFMKGEKELVQKILEAEINLFRSLRDGSALMQHMEDFYYIALLERVKSNYTTTPTSDSNNEDQLQS